MRFLSLTAALILCGSLIFAQAPAPGKTKGGRGKAAAERIAQGGFDAVLMDMVLPGISGVEAIRRIRALQPQPSRIAIIGVSGRGDDETAARAAGADAFLVKPVSPRALATALLEATRRAAAAT